MTDPTPEERAFKAFPCHCGASSDKGHHTDCLWRLHHRCTDAIREAEDAAYERAAERADRKKTRQRELISTAGKSVAIRARHAHAAAVADHIAVAIRALKHEAQGSSE